MFGSSVLSISELVNRQKQKEKNQIPPELQLQLALLWRTLRIVRESDSHQLLQAFFEEFLDTVKRLPALSLSSGWEKSNSQREERRHLRSLQNQKGGWTNTQMGRKASTLQEQSKRSVDLVGVPRVSSHKNDNKVDDKVYDTNIYEDGSESDEDMDDKDQNDSNGNNSPTNRNILPLPELSYLCSEVEDASDPLGVINKLLDSIESFSASQPPSERGIALSLCLAIAIKSGRASLLLQTAVMLITEAESYDDIDTQLLHDIHNMIRSKVDSQMLQTSSLRSRLTTSSAAATVPTYNKFRLIPLPSFASVPSSQPNRFASPTSVTSILRRSPLGSYLWSQNVDLKSIQNEAIFDYSKLSSTLLLNNNNSSQQQHYHHNYHGSTSNTSSNLPAGILMSFGKADQGKLGHGDSQLNRMVPTVIESLKDIKICKVASMSANVLAVDVSGKVYVWGAGGGGGGFGAGGSGNGGNGHGSFADLMPVLLEPPPMRHKVVDISCGLAHSLFLLEGGMVGVRGNGGNGRLGLGDLQDKQEITLLKDLDHEIVAVQCGACHSLALSRKGHIFSWGKNTQGQCGLGHLDDVMHPTLLPSLLNARVSKLAAGWEHSACITSDGSLFTWGCGYKDSRRGVIPPVLGLGGTEGKSLPELINNVSGASYSKLTGMVVDIVCGWDHCLAIDRGEYT